MEERGGERKKKMYSWLRDGERLLAGEVKFKRQYAKGVWVQTDKRKMNSAWPITALDGRMQGESSAV